MLSPSQDRESRSTLKSSRLLDRLERLESQIDRLASLLAEQAEVRRVRRRRLTIRTLLLAVALAAVFFTWFGNLYQRSRLQAGAVDQLIADNVFVMYGPRRSALVSLLPGEPEQPPATLASWLGDDFFRAVTNVSTATVRQGKTQKQSILDSVAALGQLQRLRLTNLPLKNADLAVVRQLGQLQSLDVSRTGLDYGPLPGVRDAPLRWFAASHTKLGDQGIYDLAFCRDLQELHLERTAISDRGLDYLRPLEHLRYLNLKRCPVSAAAVKKFADAMPGCVIDYEPLRFLPNGQVDVGAARRGRVRYGTATATDPRYSRRAQPPVDTADTGNSIQVFYPPRGGGFFAY